MLCCVTCVDLRHEHATHAVCVSVQCTHSTSLIRVTASDGHIAGDMTGRFALHWRSDGPAHLLDLGPSGTLATSTAAGPKMFESMRAGPLSCLKLTAVWRLSIYTQHRHHHEARHLVLSPSPAWQGPWYRWRLALANRPIQPGYCEGSGSLCCTLPLLVKLSNLTPSTRIAWSTEGQYLDMQATSPGATARVAPALVDCTAH